MGLVKIVSYNVKFGDCFLLIFEKGKEKYMLLVDCGTRRQDIKKVNFYEIAEDIKNKMRENEVQKLDFLLTHLHADHYNGISFLAKYIDRVFTGTDLFSYERSQAVKKYSMSELGLNITRDKMICVQQGKVVLHLYEDDSTEEINVLWPRKVIETDVYKDFIYGNFRDEITPLHNADKPGNFSEYKDYINNTSVVFEAEGVDGNLYLFTGDFSNVVSSSFNGPSSINLSAITEEQFAQMRRRKYRLIKVPHHGTPNYTWPIENELLQDDGMLLISWGACKSKNGWSTLYQKQERIFATNVTEGIDGERICCKDVIEISIDRGISG